jgi:hypothetical protein
MSSIEKKPIQVKSKILKSVNVESPRQLDGTPIPPDELSDFHAKLAAGEVDIVVPDEVKADLEVAGLTTEDISKLMLASVKKGMQ